MIYKQESIKSLKDKHCNKCEYEKGSCKVENPLNCPAVVQEFNQIRKKV